jgi:outer membrane protein assembly factor BamB
VLWRDAQSRRFAGFIVGKDRLLGVGDSGTNKEPFVAIIDLKTGKDIWTEKLPAKPIKGGAAIDKSGRILVSLTDGRVVCFAKE